MSSDCNSSIYFVNKVLWFVLWPFLLDFPEDFLSVEHICDENPTGSSHKVLGEVFSVGLAVGHFPSEGEVILKHFMSQIHEDGVHTWNHQWVKKKATVILEMFTLMVQLRPANSVIWHFYLKNLNVGQIIFFWLNINNEMNKEFAISSNRECKMTNGKMLNRSEADIWWYGHKLTREVERRSGPPLLHVHRVVDQREHHKWKTPQRCHIGQWPKWEINEHMQHY